jgi:hypothetical protein
MENITVPETNCPEVPITEVGRAFLYSVFECKTATDADLPVATVINQQ